MRLCDIHSHGEHTTNSDDCILQGSGDLDPASSRRTSTFGDVDPENAYTGMTKTSSLPGLIGNALGLRLPHVGGPAYQAASSSKAGPHVFKWVRAVWHPCRCCLIGVCAV